MKIRNVSKRKPNPKFIGTRLYKSYSFIKKKEDYFSKFTRFSFPKFSQKGLDGIKAA